MVSKGRGAQLWNLLTRNPLLISPSEVEARLQIDTSVRCCGAENPPAIASFAYYFRLRLLLDTYQPLRFHFRRGLRTPKDSLSVALDWRRTLGSGSRPRFPLPYPYLVSPSEVLFCHHRHTGVAREVDFVRREVYGYVARIDAWERPGDRIRRSVDNVQSGRAGAEHVYLVLDQIDIQAIGRPADGNRGDDSIVFIGDADRGRSQYVVRDENLACIPVHRGGNVVAAVGRGVHKRLGFRIENLDLVGVVGNVQKMFDWVQADSEGLTAIRGDRINDLEA